MRKLYFLLTVFFTLNAYAQTIPCNGNFSFTRQVSGSVPNSSFVSQVLFVPNDINITNPGTVTPNTFVNAAVQYGGYIWAQDWNNITTGFNLLRVDAAYNSTTYTVTGMPANTTFNNAGVDKSGLMYILTNANPAQVHTINLSSGTPTFVSTKTVTFPGLGSSESVIWGDVSVDPITNRVYAWYHPTATVTPLKGLYEITGLSGATPTLTKIGVDQPLTLGSLFFNERGQLFGYGGPLGSTQDRIYALDKSTSVATQYGLPDLAVSQSDGCECVFRISLEREVSNPIMNIPKCGFGRFSYKFTTLNYATGPASGIKFSDTLDIRLSYDFNAATIQTQLQALYGGTVAVALTSFGGGVNNVVNITNLNIALGAASFSLPVKIDASKFSASAIINQQARLSGISTLLGGPIEVSNDPTTFNPKDGTGVAINISGTRCVPPTANNFVNTPIPQGNGNTAIPALTATDPDGAIQSYTVSTLPTAAQGVLRITCPSTPMGLTCTGGFANIIAGTVLTPAEAARLTFDPAPGFSGDALFTFFATDNSNNVSNTANYVIPMTPLPPVSNNIMENSMLNSNGPTAIIRLNSTDVDGSVSSYQITTLPPVSQGVLSIPCPPTLTGASCTSGYQDLTAAILSNYPNGIPLTVTQKESLRFDPAAGFVGTSSFNYNATDNSGNVSNTANYTIPVSSTITIKRPPLANNIFTQPINNSLGNTAIPSLKASDLDGIVQSYTITSIPPAATGVLRLSCPSTPMGLTCTAGFANITAGTVLTPAESVRLFFDPASTYIGKAVFNYTALDNDGTVSNQASYTISVVNAPPTAININTVAPFNGLTAPIVPLGGSDLDGTVDSFKVTSIPPVAEGVLSVPCGTATNPTLVGATCTGGFQNLTATTLANYPNGMPLTPTQAAAVRFTPATGFSGKATFNYFTKDNDRNNSTTAAYNIIVQKRPPISNDITAPTLPNTNGSTAIPALSASDPDGSVAAYVINSLPPATSGMLFYNNGMALVAVTAGQTLTPTQISTLQFDPAANYTGLVNFTYSATDNTGDISNIANYNLPISGVGNLPPVAQNIVIPAMPNTNGTTPIPGLVSTDPDGTITSYTITSQPTTAEGVLSYNNGMGIVPVTQGLVLTPAQVATLQFDPGPTNNSSVAFTFFTTDNSGGLSNVASYTIPVTSTPPIAQPIVAPTMPQTNSSTPIPSLIGNDADGNITSFTIETIPPPSQGILYTFNGLILIPVVAGDALTPAQITTLQFDPAGSYAGNILFNYHVTDNAGLFSNATTYTLQISGNPPVSQDIIAAKMLNGNGPTAIPAPLSNDPDGSIVSYVISSLPTPAQGVLLLNGIAITLGQSLTPTQITQLQFDPETGFIGDVLFNYAAFDNNGNISNTAAYLIPVGSSAALPLHQLYITAIRIGNNIKVNWNTAFETNLNKYDILISIDGVNFTKAASLAALNNANNNYSTVLNNHTALLYFIKLRIVENNGVVNFSEIVTLRNTIQNQISIYPNPVTTNTIISLGNTTSSNYKLDLFNSVGALVWQSTLRDAQPNTTVNFERSKTLIKGLYVLKATNISTNISTTIKIFIQ